MPMSPVRTEDAAPADGAVPAAPEGGAAPATRPAGPSVPADVLHRRVSVNFRGVPLDRALARLAAEAGWPLTVDWDAVGNTTIAERTTPVTLRLRDVPADRVLALVLRSASPDPGDLMLSRRGEGLVLAQPPEHEAVEAERVEVRYDLSDLVRRGHPFRQPQEQTMADTAEIIKSMVDPGSWEEFGGTLGRMKADGATLVVETSPALHEEISALLTALRRACNGRPPAAEPAEQQARRLLARPMNVRFGPVSVKEALTRWQAAYPGNVFIDWKLMERAQYDLDRLIAVQPAGKSAGQILDEVLRAATAKDDPEAYLAKLGFNVDATGVVQITTAEALGGGHTILPAIRCYNIIPILMHPPRQWAAGGLEQRLEEVKKLVIDNVAPDSWRDSGGYVGIIYEHIGILVIQQTPESHQKIVQVLANPERFIRAPEPEEAAP